MAGISITALTQGGLFQKAEYAKVENRGASVEEAKNMWKMHKVLDENSKDKTAQTLEELVNDLVKQNLLTEEEKDQIIGNEGKGIKAQYKVTIGSRTIDFSDKEGTIIFKIHESVYDVEFAFEVESGCTWKDFIFNEKYKKDRENLYKDPFLKKFFESFISGKNSNKSLYAYGLWMSAMPYWTYIETDTGEVPKLVSKIKDGMNYELEGSEEDDFNVEENEDVQTFSIDGIEYGLNKENTTWKEFIDNYMIDLYRMGEDGRRVIEAVKNGTNSEGVVRIDFGCSSYIGFGINGRIVELNEIIVKGYNYSVIKDD